MSTTIFMFGYSGWGNRAGELVKAIDAIERRRGFKPPIFADIRISRSVRAKGFSGKAFEKLVGDVRHRWMKELGNETAKTGKLTPIKIAQPAAAGDLLDLTQEAADDQRRVIFFCSCPFPRKNGKAACHRWPVSDLLLKEAKKRKTSVEVVEWPGGEPEEIDLKLSSADFTSVAGGRKHIPVSKSFRAEYAGLPWGSVAHVHGAGGETVQRIVGPAVAAKSGWSLPVLWAPEKGEAKPSAYEREAQKLRRSLGLEARASR